MTQGDAVIPGGKSIASTSIGPVNPSTRWARTSSDARPPPRSVTPDGFVAASLGRHDEQREVRLFPPDDQTIGQPDIPPLGAEKIVHDDAVGSVFRRLPAQPGIIRSISQDEAGNGAVQDLAPRWNPGPPLSRSASGSRNPDRRESLAFRRSSRSARPHFSWRRIDRHRCPPPRQTSPRCRTGA